MDREIRGLNWGCGPVQPAGWWNSDVVDYGQAHVGSILDGLPIRSGYFDGVVANHSLQSLTHDEIPRALAELKRILRPGGRIRVLVPNILGAFEAFLESDEHWPGFDAISEPWPIDRKFAHYLTWGGQNRSCFTYITLAQVLDDAGFLARTISPPNINDEWTWLRALDTRLGESIVIEAIA